MRRMAQNVVSAIRLVFGLEVKQIGKHGFLLVVTVSMIVLVVTIMAVSYTHLTLPTN